MSSRKEKGEETKKREAEQEEEDEDIHSLMGKKKKSRATSSADRERKFLEEHTKTMNEATKLLRTYFSSSQQDRYEAFRRSALKDASTRRVMQQATRLNFPKTTVIAARGSAKLYVGELVEEARAIMDERGEQGPLRPWHVREAYERLKEQGKTPEVGQTTSQGGMPRSFSARRSVI